MLPLSHGAQEPRHTCWQWYLANVVMLFCKPLPMHYGIVKLPDGTTTTKFVNLGCAQTSDGQIYSLGLVPYTLLQVDPPK